MTADLLESARDLCSALVTFCEVDTRQQDRATAIARGRRRIGTELKRRWNRQRRALVAGNDLAIALRMEEADLPPSIADRIDELLRATITGQVGALEAGRIDLELKRALRRGAEALADQVERSLSEMDFDDYEARWIRDHGFEKLAKDVDRVTRERLRETIGTAYQRGDDYDGVKRAIRETFGRFNETRADLIAETELNAAYNRGGLEFAKRVQAKTKTWNPLGSNVCPVCIGNQNQGPIPIGAPFASGVDSPPQHPRCQCVVDFGFI